MEVYEIRPGTGIGPVEIGMSRHNAKRAMEATGHSVDSFVRWPESPPVLAMQENSFQVYFDRSDRVEAIGGCPDRRRTSRRRLLLEFSQAGVATTPGAELGEAVTVDAAMASRSTALASFARSR